MKRLLRLLFIISLMWIVPASPGNLQPLESRAGAASLLPVLARLPLYFIANQGQLDPQVNFYLQGRDKTIYFTPGGVTYLLSPSGAADTPSRRWVVRQDFAGAVPQARPTGLEKTPAVISLFKGPPGQWRAGLPTYSRITYPNLWPGIDLNYSGDAARLKYEFVLQPGADPARIRLAYHGATVTLDDQGRLEIATPAGSFQDDAPLAYQAIEGRQVPVRAAYHLFPGLPSTGQAEGALVGFDLGAYDPTRPLVIDPAVIIYSGFIGGSGQDWGQGIAVDEDGSVYVAGETASSQDTFPVAVGPDPTANGDIDAFIAKLNPQGDGLVYAGYIGGSGYDYAADVAVDPAGNAYLIGGTASNQDSFPVWGGPDLTYNGGEDAFVAKVNPSGSALVYAGYIGGSSLDRGRGIAVDAAGSAYVTGETSSSHDTFPVAIGPDLTLDGYYDAYVVKVNPSGASLAYAGYIGGNGSDFGHDIAVDNAGCAYVTGTAASNESGGFPVVTGPDLTFNGWVDAFVVKVNPQGGGFVYAGYIGGEGRDEGQSIAVDGAGRAYVAGYTYSTQETFPVKDGPDLTFNGSSDAFVARVGADGAGLEYAGYIGGSASDLGYGIAVDKAGHALVAGRTYSSEDTFPVKDGPDLTYNQGEYDAFVAKVGAAGTDLVYAGYIGGSGADWGESIAVDAAGSAYVVGDTDSTEATFPVAAGPDLTANGSLDAFVMKITEIPDYKIMLPTVLR